MAVLDLERDVVVIRIVYDGPPFAGKTTSVRALAASLSRTIETPLEAAGRTIFFDWMEYTGGLFEGHQIRCQIVSVPGQPDLAARRRALLETADVVVFVVDSGDRDAVDRSLVHVGQMVDILRAQGDPPIGVVVQANKQDLPGALTRDQIRVALGEDFARTAVTESVAETGVGIRETFVLAVRLALDRTRDLMTRGALPGGRPAVDTAEDLLTQLEGLPSEAEGAFELDEGELIGDDIASALTAAVANVKPRLPDSRVPSGAIWPPVEGRMVLHEAMSAELTTVHRVGQGDWIAGLGSGWRLHSAASAVFDYLDDGRQALLQWARLHATYGELLSPSRCVVLAEAGGETWRLWQIVKLAPSLRAWLTEDDELEAGQLLGRLAEAAAVLGEAYTRCADTRLVPSLDTIGIGEHGAQFVSLMPSLTSGPPAPRPADVTQPIARELARLLSAELLDRRAELAALAADRSFGHPPWADIVGAALTGRLTPPSIGVPRG